MTDFERIIDELCAIAGMVMEDTSAVLVRTDLATPVQKTEQLWASADAITALGQAAKALLRLGQEMRS
jgi:hypothetical protein